jgi:hypothetical protein
VEMMPLFVSLTPRSVGLFLLSLTVEKLFKCIDLAENLQSSSKIWGFGGFSYQRDPLKALPSSNSRRLSHHACKSVKPSGLHRLKGLQKKNR